MKKRQTNEGSPNKGWTDGQTDRQSTDSRQTKHAFTFLTGFRLLVSSTFSSPSSSGELIALKRLSSSAKIVSDECLLNCKHDWFDRYNYCISKLVRALWLVNSASRTLLHGPLKFKVVSVAKLLRDVSPKGLNLVSKYSIKLTFTLNCVLKRANDLKTISD